MNQYTIYCTKEQTKKAIGLGAPIDYSSICYEGFDIVDHNEDHSSILYAIIPTTEQMIGWLKDQGVYAWVRLEFWSHKGKHNVGFVHIISKLGTPIIETEETNEQVFHKSYQEAILAAIDAALEYLSN